MSKKEEKKEAAAEAPAPKGEETPAAAKKKRSIVLIAGIGGVSFLVLGGAGFFVYKTFMSKPVALTAKANPGDVPDAHGDAAKDAPKDAHGAAAKDAPKGAPKSAQGAAAKNAPKDAQAGKDDAKKVPDANGDAKKDAASDANGAKPAEAGAQGDAAKGGAGDKKEKSDDDSEFGQTLEIPRMDLNLGNPLENRFLRLAMTLEYKGGKSQEEELQKRLPQLRDLIISSVSTKSRIDLLSDKGKERLRRELTHRFNEVLERPVSSIFFTEFLVE